MQQIEERQAQARLLRWQVELDGPVLTTVRLPPSQGAVLKAAVHTMVMRQSHEPAAGIAAGSRPRWGSGHRWLSSEPMRGRIAAER